jgi:hypothetical protein
MWIQRHSRMLDTIMTLDAMLDVCQLDTISSDLDLPIHSTNDLNLAVVQIPTYITCCIEAPKCRVYHKTPSGKFRLTKVATCNTCNNQAPPNVSTKRKRKIMQKSHRVHQ